MGTCLTFSVISQKIPQCGVYFKSAVLLTLTYPEPCYIPFWSSFILVIFHFVRLPFFHLPIWLSSILFVFHLGRLPSWSCSILVVFNLGRLPFCRLPFWSPSFWV